MAASNLARSYELAFDDEDNLYIADDSWLEKVTPGGTLSIISGTGVSAYPLSYPAVTATAPIKTVQYLAVGDDGVIYISDDERIEKIAPVQPGQPSAPTAVAGNAQATVTWTAPNHAGTTAITGYVVTPVTGGIPQTPVPFPGNTAITQTITGLTNGTTYTFIVAALNVSGESLDSAVSNPVTPTVPLPPAPPDQRAPQTLTFAPPASVPRSHSTLALSATATSGLPPAFTASPAAICTVTGSTLTLNGAGTCIVAAVQNGDGAFKAAAPVTASIGIEATSVTTLPTGVSRLSGEDRIATSTDVSREIFTEDSRAYSVVVATSAVFADSIAGARLAALEEGPLLLTGTDALDASVADEVRRLVRPGGSVYILGQTAALSTTVQAALEDLSIDYSVTRLGGTNRFETAVAIADDVTAQTGDVGPIYLVSGGTFADGISTAALADHTGGVVLLTNGAQLPAATAAYLAEHDPAGTRVIPVGGAAATAAVIVAPSAGRAIVGADRYETSQRVAEAYADAATTITTIGVANGVDWPDALVGAAAMGHLDGPLLLTAPASLSASTRNALENLTATLGRGLVFGGPSAITDATLTQIATLIPTG